MSVKTNNPLTYISLFSGAGIGCHGFKMEGFKCIVTQELLEKRLRIQKYNNKCELESGYISGDITRDETKNKVFKELDKWNIGLDKRLDVLIATPPCQGMSVANHKKGNEKTRNSLVVESIKLVNEIKPKFFIFENVRTFLNTICTDIDGKDKKIKEAIEINLAGNYHIVYQVINFKDYGCPSSRTRTLVIGTNKVLKEMTPYSIFPEIRKEQSLREVIGHLPSLNNMGDICTNDIYHNFRKYEPSMFNWIKDIKEGQSAFDNKDPLKIPHKVIDGIIKYNENKNSDKYKRQFWHKPAPCIHTRNDILASQNTIHPTDDRVFSIRELMIMMSIPDEFKWSYIPFNELCSLTHSEKTEFLKKEELNIRHSIGEAVPTIIFQSIAAKIRDYLSNIKFEEREIKKLIDNYKLFEENNLINFVSENNQKYKYSVLSKVSELSNTSRSEKKAYYTSQDICFSIIKDLPDAKNFKSIRILEPSVGVGNFIPLLIEKYRTVENVIIDVVDIDSISLKILKSIIPSLRIPKNVKINFIHDDFLMHTFDNKYDIIVGNPPFKKIENEKELLSRYKTDVFNDETNNIFSYFIEKTIKLGGVVSLITPKSLLNAPEFNKTRRLLNNFRFYKLTDYGEFGFKGVKIETISFIINTKKKPRNNKIIIESYIKKQVFLKTQKYIFSDEFPYWIIYRNDFFDSVCTKLNFDIFNAYRDRQITKKHTKAFGNIRVLKSRNISSNRILNITGYDCYIDGSNSFGVLKYLNRKDAVLVPNLTYNPRACFLPKNSITDGSVAILTLKNGSRPINKNDLEYYNTKEFEQFYSVARNHGTRSLNIDNNSVFFFGIKKKI